MGGLGSSTEKFDADYFTPHPISIKVTNPRSDELGSDDRTQPLMPELSIPLEPSLPSPTPASLHSEDSFPIVVGVPSSFQLAVVTPSVIVAAVPSPAVFSKASSSQFLMVYTCLGILPKLVIYLLFYAQRPLQFLAISTSFTSTVAITMWTLDSRYLTTF